MGLYVERNLRKHLHNDHVCGKLNRVLLHLRNYLPVEELLTIYHSMVYTWFSGAARESESPKIAKNLSYDKFLNFVQVDVVRFR